MGKLTEATLEIFGDNDKLAEGDSTLLAAISALNDVRRISVDENTHSLKYEGRIEVARIAYKATKDKVEELNLPELDKKFQKLQTIFADEITEILASSGKDRRSRISAVLDQRRLDHK